MHGLWADITPSPLTPRPHPEQARDPISTVYNLIREHVDAVSGPAVNVEDILPKVLARGCTKEHLAETLTEYEELGVWHLNNDRSIIRFAAADGASDTFRPKAISWVMAGGLISAVIGPQMVKLTSDMLAPVPFAGAYAFVILLNVVACSVFWFLDSPKPAKPQPGDAKGRSVGQLLRTPPGHGGIAKSGRA